MTYSTSNQLNYALPKTQPQYGEPKQSKLAVLPTTVAGAALGGIAGTGYGVHRGSLKSYISSDGKVADSFVKTTYKKYVDTIATNNKEAYDGSLNILKKLKSVKNPEELKQLFEANQKAAEEICKELSQTPENFIKNITADNLEENKKLIKQKIDIGNKARYQNLKNQIQACWSKEKKEFVKNENVSDEVFNLIKRSSSKINWKMLGKFAAIGSSLSAIIAFVTAKFLLK